MLCARYTLDNTVENSGSKTTKDTWTVEPTYKVGGIYAKAMADGEMKWDADTTASILNNREFTWAAWIYIDPNVSLQTAPLFGNGDFGANNNRKYFINQGPTRNDVSWSWMNDAGAITFISGSLTDVLKDFEWTHVAITYGKNTFRIYINGINEYTQDNVVSNSSSFKYITSVFYSNPARRLQDVRIYDEAISSEEVKKLAYGLQLHDKLNDIGGVIRVVDKDVWEKNSSNWNYHDFKKPDGSFFKKGEPINVSATISNIVGDISSVTVLFYYFKHDGASNDHGCGSVEAPVIGDRINITCSPNENCPSLLIYAGTSGATANKGMTLTNLKISNDLLINGDYTFTVDRDDCYVHTGLVYNGLTVGKNYVYKVKCSSPNNVLKAAHGGADGNSSNRAWVAWLYMQDGLYNNSNYGGYQSAVDFNSSNYSHRFDGEYHYWTFKATKKNVSVRLNGYKGSSNYELTFPEIMLYEEGKSSLVSDIAETPRYDKSVLVKDSRTVSKINADKSNSMALSLWFKINDLTKSSNLITCAASDAYTHIKEMNYTADGSFDNEKEYDEASSDGVTFKTGSVIANSGRTEYIYTPYSKQGIIFSHTNGNLQLQIDDSQKANVGQITDDNWHHIVINVDGFRNADAYLDNEKTVSVSPKTSYTIDRASSSGQVVLSGGIYASDFRLYGRHLTEDECLRLFGIAPEDYDLTN